MTNTYDLLSEFKERKNHRNGGYWVLSSQNNQLCIGLSIFVMKRWLRSLDERSVINRYYKCPESGTNREREKKNISMCMLVWIQCIICTLVLSNFRHQLKQPIFLFLKPNIATECFWCMLSLMYNSNYNDSYEVLFITYWTVIELWENSYRFTCMLIILNCRLSTKENNFGLEYLSRTS